MHWWAELWDNWAKTFGYDHWEWGSASDAFAAIGTVGALAVTLHIVRKDRRDKTEELARGVFGWYEARQVTLIDRGKPQKYTIIRVDVHNSSLRPVTLVRAYYFTNDPHIGLPIREGSGQKHHENLLPNTNGFFETRNDNITPAGVKQVIITFLDADGRSWTRNLLTQEIMPNKSTKFKRKVEYWSWLIKTGGGRWGEDRGEL